MKNFSQFIKEEAELKGNEGLPKDWMDKTDRKAQRELGVTKDEPKGPPMRPMPPGFRPPPGMPPPPPPGTRMPGRQTFETVNLLEDKRKEVSSILMGHDEETVKTKLAELAELAVRDEFGKILDSIEFDIKMVNMGKVTEDIPKLEDSPQNPKSKEDQADDISKDSDDENGESGENENKPFDSREEALNFLNSDKLKRDIDKKKLIDMVIQGEGINTKNIMHGDIVKDGFNDLFGEEDGSKILRLYNEITKLYVQLNWLETIEDSAKSMANNPTGHAISLFHYIV